MHIVHCTWNIAWNIEYSSVAHAFTNCHCLKYLHEYDKHGEYDSKYKECLLCLSRNTVIHGRHLTESYSNRFSFPAFM